MIVNHTSKERFLIVGTGRSGSSLLAGILALAGADFGIPGRENWDRVKGHYEHPLLHKSFRYSSRAKKLAESMIPDIFGRKYLENRSLKFLAEALADTTYLKSTALVWLVSAIRELGYSPRIIVQFRRFEGYARSRYIKFGWPVDKLVAEYVNTYETTLMQLMFFGGCVVNYDDLTDKSSSQWAEALSHLTGLNAKTLIEKRNSIVVSTRESVSIPILDDRPNQLEKIIVDLVGKQIEGE